MRPSQPSRQMQENESPLPTHVPPFTQGLGRQLLFLAVKGEGEKTALLSARGRRGASARDPEAPGQTGPGAGGQSGGPGERGTCHPRPRPVRPLTHRCYRCCPSSPGGRRSGTCPHCRSTCRRCCRCRRHTGTRLWAHGRSVRMPAAAGGPGAPGAQGHSREWQVLPFQPSSHAQ